MSFIQTFWRNLTEGSGPLLVEMEGPQRHPYPAARLAQMVAQARAWLHAEGLRSGDRVAFVAPNSARWVALDLACLFDGLVSVPLYTRSTAEELRWTAADAQAKLLLADAGTLQRLREAADGEPAVRIEPLDALFEHALAPRREPPAERDASETVTLVYTSGTSGDPKGVMLTAGGFDYMLPLVRRKLDRLMGGRPADERLFHYLPFCFAGSRLVLWVSLYGAVPLHLNSSLERLAEELRAARPHYVLNVPVLLERVRGGVEQRFAERGPLVQRLHRAAMAAFEREVSGAAPRPADRWVRRLADLLLYRKVREGLGGSLRCLISGSAPLAEGTQRWFEALGIPVYQVYGLTETTGILTMDEPGEAVPGHVGRLIEGTEARVAEDGELRVRGPGIFPGYWRRPEATAAAFDEAGWFRTGDRAELDEATNTWRLVGRAKHVLVLASGHNVPPEPIEQALLEQLPGAEHVVLFGHGEPALVALVSGEGLRQADLDRAMARVNDTLPHYKRVRAIALLPEPLSHEAGLLTANQKLKRAAIAERYAELLAELQRRAGRQAPDRPAAPAAPTA